MSNLKRIFAAAEAWSQKRRKGIKGADPSHWEVRKRPLHKAKDADYEARRSEVPPDTRSLTGILLGDPIPNDPRRQVTKPCPEISCALPETDGLK